MKTARELTKLSNLVSREFEDDIINKIGVECEKRAVLGKKSAEITLDINPTSEQERYIKNVLNAYGYETDIIIWYWDNEERKKDKSLRNYRNCTEFKLSWWD